MNPRSSLRSLALAGLFLLGWSSTHAHAATFTVKSTSDTDGSSCGVTCTLRQALNAANAKSDADTITFAPTVFGSSKQIISLSAQLPTIATSVTITGPSTPGAGITLDAKGGSILSINSGSNLTLSYLTLTGGGERDGAAIDNNGTLTMSNCTVSGNNIQSNVAAVGAFFNGGIATVSNCTFSNNSVSAPRDTAGFFGFNALGGAICNFGPALTLSNCTFANCSSGGTGSALGGALYSCQNRSEVKVKVTNCTFTGNSAASLGGAIYNSRSTLEVSSCTFASNSTGSRGAIFNCAGGTLKLSNSIVVGNSQQDISNVTEPSRSTFISGGHNLVGSASGAIFAASDKTGMTSEQVNLGALADNGGPTQTLALLPGSIAIDAGQTTLTADQRGVKRPQGTAPDIGAFELKLPLLTINSPSIKEGNRGTTVLTFVLTLSQASTNEVSVLVNTRQGTANAGSDYVSVGRATVTFAPGTTTQTFTVQVIGDTQVEGDEQLRLDLRSPVNATLGTASGIGTIMNDDSAPKSTVARSAPSS